MPPLTPQRTLESVLSWWSDSNPTGPNLSLHAAAKPLMRFLYHRAVLEFMAKPRDVLTVEDMEIYCSYLAYKYVSPATKCTILADLGKRAQSSIEAPIIANSMMDLAPQLLASRDRKLQRLTCYIFGALANQEGTETAMLTYNRLASSLDDTKPETEDSETALYLLRSRNALFQILEGTQATADRKVEAVKEFIGVVYVVLVTTQRRFGFTGGVLKAPTFAPCPKAKAELTALAEDLYRLAVTVVEEYKQEFEVDTTLLYQISEMERQLDRVQRPQIFSEKSVFGWSASAETTIQSLLTNTKQALDLFSVQSRARAQRTIQMVEDVRSLGLTKMACDH